MIGIVEGLLELGLGIWLIRRFRRPAGPTPEQRLLTQNQQQMARMLKDRQAALDVYAETIRTGLKSMDNLEKLTAEDAIKREQRAKAALKAVLVKNGCSEADIENVMASVDGTEDGDLKT